MAVGFLLITTMLGPSARPEQRIRIGDPVRALRHLGLLTLAVTALIYNFGFFTILAYTPFILGLGAHGLGLIYFGWGLFLAVTSVFVAPWLEVRVGTLRPLLAVLTLLGLLLVAMGMAPRVGVIALVIASGALLGIKNTLVTQGVMLVSPAPRPVASAGYNFVRWISGALAPYLAGRIAEDVGPRVPFSVSAGALVVAVVVLCAGRAHLGASRRPRWSRSR